MLKCITCGAEATFIPYWNAVPTYCGWCSANLPGGITDVAIC